MTETDAAARLPQARPIAQGDGWDISEVICHLGPRDRPFEEHFGRATLAAVIGGTFQCRTATGTAQLYPGAFLLGNAGSCFECAHRHGLGDRCIAFHFGAALFEEIAATAAGSRRFRFRTPMLPACNQLARCTLASALSAAGRVMLAPEELALAVAEAVVNVASAAAPASCSPSAGEQRRLAAALRHIEEHSADELSLADLANVACMSRYHFLRTFRRTYGITPHQFVLHVRTRRAAMQLCTSSAPISTIAFQTGFGDLSTFNRRLRRLFGVPPGALRPRRDGVRHKRRIPRN